MSNLAEIASNMPAFRQAVNMHMSSMAEVESLLAAILMQSTADPVQIALSDKSPPQVITKDFPYPGAQRAIVQRNPIGVQNFGAASGIIFDADVNRLGGYITNIAAAGVRLYLGDRASAEVGCLYLPTNESWDFRLSNLVWCGSVFALPDSGAVEIAGASV